MIIVTKEEYMSKIDEYIQNLKYAEKSENTIKKYHLAIKTFMNYANNKQWEQSLKDGMLEYKKYLESKYKVATVNLYIIALNTYLKYINKPDLCLQIIKVQEKANNLEKSFTMDEYNKLAKVAKLKEYVDTYYIMIALAGTGIRISELQFLTVNALQLKGMNVINKGKVRYVPISEKLSDILLDYCFMKGITEGYVFYARSPQKPIHRTTVSRRLKELAKICKIDENKAYPHSLRHLFAKRYMEIINNITILKALLGHSDLRSTMIYTNPTNEEKRKDMDKLGFY